MVIWSIGIGCNHFGVISDPFQGDAPPNMYSLLPP